MPVSELRGGPRNAPWTEHDRLLMLGLKAYEDDLCSGCGWPRTYTMHAQAKGHWHASNAIRCHGCTVRAEAEEGARKAKNLRAGAYFAARPGEGMWHAMSDPILTYDDPGDRPVTGASGIVYPPTNQPDTD